MPERGRAAVLVDDYKFEIWELPTPEVEPEGILIRVTGCGVCGSDLHLWRGDIRLHGYIQGHELVGMVHSMGSGVSTDYLQQTLKEGDRVVFTYFTPCHRCYNCIRGEYTDCPTNFQMFKSVEEYPYCHGGFADYYYLRPGTFVFRVDSDLSDEALTSVNCAAGTVMEGIERSNLQAGHAIVFQGAGGLGLYGMAYARERGGRAHHRHRRAGAAARAGQTVRRRLHDRHQRDPRSPGPRRAGEGAGRRRAPGRRHRGRGRRLSRRGARGA